jgi:hypothetical protein
VSSSQTGHKRGKRFSHLILDISAAKAERGTSLLEQIPAYELRHVSEAAALTDPQKPPDIRLPGDIHKLTSQLPKPATVLMSVKAPPIGGQALLANASALTATAPGGLCVARSAPEGWPSLPGLT